MRYLWDFYQDYLESAGAVTRLLMRPLFHRLRLWDYASAQRVDPRYRKLAHRGAPGQALVGKGGRRHPSPR